MNIYLITREDGAGYDEYDSAVVVAATEEAARLIHPGGRDDWDGKVEKWGSWIPACDVLTTYIGKFDNENYIKDRVICASFNAG